MVPRFESDPDRGGVEKLAISPIQLEMLAAPIKQFKVEDFCPTEAGSLGPMSLFHVKGWSRSVAAIACMLYAYAMPEAFQVQYLELVECRKDCRFERVCFAALHVLN